MNFVQFLYIIIATESSRLALTQSCPSNLCSCDTTGPWSCKISQNEDQIDCVKTQINPVNVNLELIYFNYDRKLSFFTNCKINILKISSDSIPSNQLVRNIESLNYLIIDGNFKDPLSDLNGELDNLLDGFNELIRLKIENIKLPIWSNQFLKSCYSINEIVFKNLRISSIDQEAFVNCIELKTLIIRFNRISSIFISSFKGLRKLTSLILSSNECKELIANGNGWWELMNLMKLDISSNNLTKLTIKMFIGLRKLKQLYLNDNKIEFIDHSAFEGLDELKYLNLQDNLKLITFDLRSFNPMRSTLVSLTISLKPIQCIEGISILSTFHNDIQKIFKSCQDCQISDDFTQITYFADTTSNLPISTAQVSKLTVIIIGLVLGIQFFVLISVIVAIIIYMRKKDKKNKTSMKSISNSIESRENHESLLDKPSKSITKNNSLPDLSNTNV